MTPLSGIGPSLLLDPADLEQRLDRVQAWNEASDLNRIEPGSKQLGIICDGIAYQYAREVFPKASFLKIGITFPLSETQVKEFNQSQSDWEVKWIVAKDERTCPKCKAMEKMRQRDREGN